MRSQPGRVAVFVSAVLVCLVLLISALCCYVCPAILNSIWFEVSCAEDDSPARAFPIEDLLLDELAFPEAWEVGGDPYHPEARLPAEQIALTLFADPSECPTSLITGHDIYRFYGGARCADMGYRSKTLAWFATWEGYDSWSPPAELSYQSPVANRFRLDCCTRQGDSLRICQAVGQYEEYVVRFHTSVDPGHPECMSFVDLERILVAIDEQMALVLGKDTP